MQIPVGPKALFYVWVAQDHGDTQLVSADLPAPEITQIRSIHGCCPQELTQLSCCGAAGISRVMEVPLMEVSWGRQS